MTALLSSTYFGPVQWYQKLNRYDEVLIDHCDSYVKQTYRNRCLIAATNGVQALSVPTVHSENDSLVRISDHGNWRHQHWQALTSAYGDSPFFQYYEDDLRPFFTGRWERLYDFNEAIRQKMCELLDIQPKVTIIKPGDAGRSGRSEDARRSGRSGDAGNFRDSQPPVSDFREAINPKHPLPDPDFEPRRYYQVYEGKHGFLPNLSILDLLFNMGPEAVFWL